MPPSPKTDRLRELREARFHLKPVPKPQKIAEAKATRVIVEVRHTPYGTFIDESAPISKEAIASVINDPSPNQSPNAYARNARWRDKNREQYNESQKVLMQKRRKAKATDKG